MEGFSVILFYSSSSALRMEKLCGEKGLTVKLMPVPRQLSSDCGICLRFQTGDRAAVDAILGSHPIEHESIRTL